MFRSQNRFIQKRCCLVRSLHVGERLSYTGKLRRKGTMTEECTINVYLLSLSWKRQQIKTMGWEEEKMKIKSYKHKQTQTSRQSQSFQLRRSKNVEANWRSTERGSTLRSSTELLHVSLSPQPSPLKTSILTTLQLDVPRTQPPLQLPPFHSRNQNKLRQRSYPERIQTLSKHTHSKKVENSKSTSKRRPSSMC